MKNFLLSNIVLLRNRERLDKIKIRCFASWNYSYELNYYYKNFSYYIEIIFWIYILNEYIVNLENIRLKKINGIKVVNVSYIRWKDGLLKWQRKQWRGNKSERS